MPRSRRALAGLAALLLALAAGAGCGSDEEASGPLAGDAGRALPEPAVQEIYGALGSDDPERMRAGLERIREAGDRRFVAVLIELLHYGQMELVPLPAYNRLVVVLEELSGESFGGDWFAWAEWYAGTELEPPPGFLAWKGDLLARIDPAYGELLAAGRPSRLRPEEIQWGGVRLEGIPALDAPPRVPAAEAGYLEPGEPVLGLSVDGEARAYPLRILDWHEIVNDRFGERSVTLAYSALCGSALAYEAPRAQGRRLAFSTSGLLYRSNQLMLERGSRTLFGQLTGRPLLGPLADEAARLEAHPVVVASWEAWRSRHPETAVLAEDTGFDREYAPGEPYGHYYASSETLYPVALEREELAAKERVFGLRGPEGAKAWPLARLLEAGVLNDGAHGTPIVLVARDERVRVETTGARGGEIRYDAGAPVRAYRRGERRFEAGEAPESLRDAEGGRWRITEAALVGPDGARAPRATGTLAYWFAWQAFHPETELHAPER